MDRDGKDLAFCGYLGGTADDRALGLAVDFAGNLFVTGYTESTGAADGFPVTVGPDLTGNGDADAFVARISAFTLTADSPTFSITSGNAVTLDLNAGEAGADRPYLVLGSLTGTYPGIALPSGPAQLPLVWDAFTNFTVQMANTTCLEDFLGILDAEGKARCPVRTRAGNDPTLRGGAHGPLRVSAGQARGRSVEPGNRHGGLLTGRLMWG